MRRRSRFVFAMLATLLLTALPSLLTADVQGQTDTESSYLSPTYGYSLEWDDSWDADNPTTVGDRDFLRLRQPGIKAELIGESWDSSIGTCFDWVSQDYATDPPYSEVVGSIDDTSPEGVITGIIEFTYTNQSDLITTDYVIDVLCAPIPSQPDYLVTLKQTVKTAERAEKENAVSVLQDGFSLTDGASADSTPSTGLPTVEPAATLAPLPTAAPATPTPTPSPSPEPQPDSMYVSPTYGYGLSWDVTWKIVGEWSEGGVDFLGLESDSLIANLYGEPWDPTFGSCFDWYVNFYANSPEYSNVVGAPEPAAADGSIRGVVSLVYADPGGSSVDLRFHVICAPVAGNPDAVVTLEQFVSVADEPGQLDAIAELQAGFSLVAVTGSLDNDV